MAIIRRTLVLTGGRANRTCTLHKWRFNNGTITLTGDEKSVEGEEKFLGRVFAAYAEGSAELAAAQRRDRGDVTPATSAGEPAVQVQGGVQHQQPGPAPVPADDGGRATDTPPGGTGSVPPGDGLEDARAARIRAAVAQLDPAKDEHWTAEGLPRVDVVAQLAGEQSVSRRDLTRYTPDAVRNR